MKKRFVLASIFIFVLAASFAESKDDKYYFEKPDSDQVMIIGKITVNCPVDTDFLREALNTEAEELNAVVTLGKEGYDGFFIDTKNKYNTRPNGSFFSLNVKPSNDVVELYGINYHIFNDIKSRLILPILKKCSVPKKAKYIYIGSYYFDVDPYTFLIKSVKVTDEFDKAQDFLNEISKSEKLELVRGQMQNINVE
ncbi:MAG: hypothetical protein HUK25_09790 [Treponema sp.]|nr:hypothetical protein [Treponema sp.]